MANESSDPIEAAMIATEKEIAGFAWDNEETDALDASGDRSLEEQGEGLEGQHEQDYPDDIEGLDADGEGESEEGTGTTPEPVAAKPGETQPTRVDQEGRVPPVRLREANERARAAEAERDAERNARAEERTKLAALEAQMATLTQMLQGQRQQPQAAQPKTDEQTVSEPDIFEDPKGFTKSIRDTVQSEVGKVLNTVRQASVATSFEIAHIRHGDAFPQAMEAVNKLKIDNPSDRMVVQDIYNSPNPGEALVSWHKRNKTLAEVGDDPAAYRERVAKETREALLKDPEFRKQLIADMRGEAATGDDGRPRTTTRLPKSLNGAQGSNVGTSRVDPDQYDGSPQAIADAAWR